MPAWGWTVVAGIVLAVVIASGKFVTRAIAHELVREINGSLGLSELKDEVAGLRSDIAKGTAERSQIQTQVTNLEQQLEAILTDI